MARKRRWAVIAGVFWLLGFDIAPLAHMVLHGALERHHHGHQREHAHAHEHEQEKNAPPPAEHGEGSVAHRDLAANAPAPAVPEVLEALLGWTAPPIPSCDGRPSDRHPRTTRARAPPNVAA